MDKTIGTMGAHARGTWKRAPTKQCKKMKNVKDKSGPKTNEPINIKYN